VSVDKEKIAQRISDIQTAICNLAKYAKMDEGEFLSDDEKMAAAKYYLIAMIEGCISLCTHILAKDLHKVPDTYTTCFKILADNNYGFHISCKCPIFSGRALWQTGFRRCHPAAPGTAHVGSGTPQSWT